MAFVLFCVLACAAGMSAGCDSSTSEARDAGDGPRLDGAALEPDAGLDAALRDAAPSDAAEPRLDADAIVDAGDAALAAADAANVPDAGPPFVCEVQAATSCPEPAPRYADVAPIFMERCVICHAGTWNGPWPLNDYQHVADWEDTIRTNLLDCTMPPADAGVPMTRAEREQILTWLRCGLPR